MPRESYSELKTGMEMATFSFWSSPQLSDNPSALNNTNVVFISATSAVKYFGKGNPIDQLIVLNNQFGKTNYMIKGVFADMKDNSDIQYNMLFSLETLKILPT